MLAAGTALLPVEGRAAKDELVIGITQFPSTLHPNIDFMAAKSYVLGMAQRPFTAYDHDWELACFLCTELPTFENGKAVREPLPEGAEGQAEGREGVALTYTIQPGATWGDGTPVTTEDVLFTYEVGKHPKSGISNAELYRRILGIDVIDDRTFVVHADRITFNYNGLGDFRVLPAHLERPIFEAIPPAIAIAPPSIPTRPIPACGSAPIGSATSRAAPTSRSSATRPGGARRRTSSASWSR